MNDSKYQLAIYDKMANSSDHLAIDAVAGSGKSTTLERSVKHLDPMISVGMFAFNRDITVAMQERMAKVNEKPLDLTIKTLNAFGWEGCRLATGARIVTKEKNDLILKKYFDMNDRNQRSYYYKVKGLVNRLMTLFKANCIFDNITDSQIVEYCDNYSLTLPKGQETLDLIREVWSVSSTLTSMVDFNDQVYMAVKYSYPLRRFGIAMVDESQDLDPIQQELVLRVADRIVMVGDPRQAIYGFRGADPKSMENMIKRIGATRMPLSVCYRCPKNVVKRAQKIVPYMEYADFAPDGIVDGRNLGQFRLEAKPGDFVLCRTTAPLVTECLRMIRQDKPAMVKGKSIGEDLVNLIDSLGLSDFDSTTRLYDTLCTWHVEQLARLERAERQELIDSLNDRVETVKVLLEACKQIKEVKERIERIFSDKVYGTIFSTIHKAKGLESVRVWILRPDLLPHPNAKTPWALEQEEHLEYVAITRAMFKNQDVGELYFVV